jgi:dTDP-glucose 4,6-dehydratase
MAIARINTQTTAPHVAARFTPMPERMLITGCEGFVGSHFLEHFAATGRYEMCSTNLDVIIHLAEASSIDKSIINPMDFVERNIKSTLLTLECARGCPNLKKFIYFSTDEVFGPAPEGIKFKEWHRYNSCNPYAASKAAGEELCLAWATTYGVPVIITHCQNLIGKRQPAEKFLPTVVRAAVKCSSVKVYADPDTGKPASRDYLHARDAASAVLFLLEKGQFRNKYNISANRPISSLELINQVNDILDVKIAFEMVSAASVRPGFSVRYGLDGSKLLQMGWKPPKTFEQNLRSTVAWMIATENKKWLEL